MIPITIVDNFYTDPYKIREFALSQEFGRPAGNISWPGKRTRMMRDIDPKFDHDFATKILNLFFDTRRDQLAVNIDVMFQLTEEKYEKGWVHLDGDITFAGVVYLTPDAPKSAGTSIYKSKDNKTSGDQKIKAEFYSGAPIDKEVYKKARDENNNLFEKTLDIENVFNRLVIYPSTAYHAENNFFGSNDNDSRLTQVFFASVQSIDCYSNLDRCKILINI